MNFRHLSAFIWIYSGCSHYAASRAVPALLVHGRMHVGRSGESKFSDQAVFAELVWEPIQGATYPIIAARNLTSSELQSDRYALWSQALPCQSQTLCATLDDEEAQALEEVVWNAGDE